MQRTRPLIVGIGGTLRPRSSSELALRCCLKSLEEHGARTIVFAGEQLNAPIYSPGAQYRNEMTAKLIAALREADAVVISSPGYHGSISGLIKNILDYVEDMKSDEEPYLDGRAVGCIVSAAGWQAATTTLSALRDIVHALRGWPTPLGISLNSAAPLFDESGACLSEHTAMQFKTMANHIIGFAQYRRSQKNDHKLAS
jgi:FMN reductase